MQDRRPRFTGSLIMSTLIHFGVPFLAAMILSLTQIDFKENGLALLCYVYVPFAMSGCAIGLYPHLARPVLAALVSASLVFAISYMSWNILAAPAIFFSTLSAFLIQRYKANS